jgi:hypothetical protein
MLNSCRCLSVDLWHLSTYNEFWGIPGYGWVVDVSCLMLIVIVSVTWKAGDYN